VLKIELLTTGDELLEGVISDTNATYIARELQQLGLTAQRINTVGDSLKVLSSTLTEISQRADICVITGGLGPTSDDLTLDALALSAGVPLEVSKPLWTEIQAFYKRLGREAPLTNRVFLKGARL
jgi:molybdenum cofactor synthesis domain-containing protein